MNFTKKALAGLICMFAVFGLALPAHATGITVASLRVDTSTTFAGWALVTLNGWTSTACPPPPTNPPTVGYSTSLGFDTTTAAGKSALSVVMAALLSNKTITFYSSGTCGAFGVSMEFLTSVTIVN